MWCGVVRAVRCGVVPSSSMRQQIQCPTTPEKDHVKPGIYHHSPFSHHATHRPSTILPLSLTHTTASHSGRQPAISQKKEHRYATRWLSSRFCREWEGAQPTLPGPPHHTTRRSDGRAVSKSVSESLSPHASMVGCRQRQQNRSVRHGRKCGIKLSYE